MESEPGWLGDFPSNLTHSHSFTLAIDWSGCVGIRKAPPVPPPPSSSHTLTHISPCAMKLIIATEITDSHSNLDIFRGVGMMMRLYWKWDITPFFFTPPPLSLSPSLPLFPLTFIFYLFYPGVLFSPRRHAFIFIVNIVAVHFQFPPPLFHLSIVTSFTLLTLPLCNFTLYVFSGNTNHQQPIETKCSRLEHLCRCSSFFPFVHFLSIFHILPEG